MDTTVVKSFKETENETVCIVEKYDENSIWCYTMVYHNDKYIIVYSLSYWTEDPITSKEIPIVSLVKRKSDTLNIKRKFQRVLGKMVLKNVQSKYFGNVDVSEHLINGVGDLTEREKEEIMGIVMNNIPEWVSYRLI